MKVKINDKALFLKKNRGLIVDDEKLEGFFDVHAIINISGKKSYIIIINDCLEYIRRDSVTIIDDKLPSNWVYKEYIKPLIIKRSYDAFGFDYISVESFIGPSEFIDDSFFLLNIYFYPKEAYILFNKFLAM